MNVSRAAPPRWRQTVLVLLAAALIVVLAASQVGGEREFLVLLMVTAAIVGLIALSRPQWLVFAGAALAFAAGYAVVGIPVPELGALLIIAGTVAMKRDRWYLPEAVVILIPLLLAWALFVAWPALSQPEVSKRLLSITLWALLIVVVALPGSARHYVARGLLAGLIVSLPAGLVVGSDYGSRLAGLVSDPNSFAMIVAVTTPLIVGELQLSRWRVVGVWGFSFLLVALADSRTGMLSIGTALLVFLTVQKLRWWALGVPFLALWAASRLPDDVVRGGRWEERSGSDTLRANIDEASMRQIAESPWIGHGLGRGSLDLAAYGDPPRDLTFFLHNSYKLIVTEMGIIGMSIYALVAFGAVATALRGVVARGPVAAIAAAGVMATQLGEVFFAVPVAMALGFAWGSTATPPETLAPTSSPSALEARAPGHRKAVAAP